MQGSAVESMPKSQSPSEVYKLHSDLTTRCQQSSIVVVYQACLYALPLILHNIKLLAEFICFLIGFMVKGHV